LNSAPMMAKAETEVGMRKQAERNGLQYHGD